MPSTMKARKALLRGPPRPRRLRRLRWEWVIDESLSVGASEASTSGREPLAHDLLAGARQTFRLQAPQALQPQRRLPRRALGRRALLTADRETGAPGKRLGDRDVLAGLRLEHLDGARRVRAGRQPHGDVERDAARPQRVVAEDAAREPLVRDDHALVAARAQDGEVQ